MVYYKATMTHSAKTFERLAHMQYDLFCRGNLVGRTILAFGLMMIGIVNYTQWWGLLLIAYASYLLSSKYASANHTARKLSEKVQASGLGFPVSRYEFQENSLNIITLPENVSLGDPIGYDQFERIGEDTEYFYLFRNQYGGYMVPKAELGDQADAFRTFIEKKTSKSFRAREIPAVRAVRAVRSLLKK